MDRDAFYARLDKLKENPEPDNIVDIIECLAEYVLGPREQANDPDSKEDQRRSD